MSGDTMKRTTEWTLVIASFIGAVSLFTSCLVSNDIGKWIGMILLLGSFSIGMALWWAS